MTKTIHGCFKKHLGNEAAFWSSVGTEVNGGEWYLCTSAAMHGIEVVYEAFHGLEGLMLGVFMGFFNDLFWDLSLFKLLVVAEGNVVFNSNIELLAGKFFVFLEVFLERLAEGFIYGRSQAVVKVRNRLAAMLFVLVSLEDNGGESGSGANGLRSAEETMASIKTAFKELENISLAASERTGC